MRVSTKICPASGTGSADTPQRRAVELEVDALVPVAEALIPRTVVVELRRRPVPNGGIRTGYVKTADGVAILEQHMKLALRRHPPVLVAARLQGGAVVSTILPGIQSGRIGLCR